MCEPSHEDGDEDDDDGEDLSKDLFDANDWNDADPADGSDDNGGLADGLKAVSASGGCVIAPATMPSGVAFMLLMMFAGFLRKQE